MDVPRGCDADRTGAGALLLPLAAAALAGVLIAAAPATASAPKGENGLIAFDSGAGVNGDEIYAVNPDGSEPRNLTNTTAPTIEGYPAFSANGSRVFFVRSVGPVGPGSIWSIAVDGSDPVNHLSTNTRIFGLTPSPDGRLLAFTASGGGGQDLWVLALDGSGARNITSTPGEGEDSPSFSPDGESIAYARCVGMDPCDIWAIAPDGGGRRPLITTPGVQEQEPSFSPDGLRIAFNRFSGGRVNVWTMDADGSAQAVLTATPGETEDDSSPAYSGDGEQILFERCTATCDLISIPAAGGAALNLTPALGIDVSEPDAQSIQRCGKRVATIVGDDGPDEIVGTDGPDVIVTNAGDDRVNGRGGKDVICGEEDNDRLRGGKGRDRILGGDGKDRLGGGGGNDRLIGGKGRDRLIGGKGRKDRCRGGKGKDRDRGCERGKV